MAKSTDLNFTQNINNVYVKFFSSDKLRVVSVSTSSNGSNLTTGTRTFTAAAGTVQTSGVACTWTAPVTDSRIVGQPNIINGGDYLVAPTLVSNPAAVDSGSSNATWTLRAEIYKDLYTASSSDAVIKSINVTSFDTLARVMSLWIINIDEQPVLMGSVSIAASSGSNGTAPSIDLLGGSLIPSLTYDANGKRIIPLKAGEKLAVSVPAVSVGAQINVTATIEEY